MDTELRNRLLQAAQAAAAHAYNPFSHFSVGAAVADPSGAIHRGCNVENSSFGLTCCAERSALFAAISNGVQPGALNAMVIYVPGNRIFESCGACRQVMLELMDKDAEILSCCDDKNDQSHRLFELLPSPFNLDEGQMP